MNQSPVEAPNDENHNNEAPIDSNRKSVDFFSLSPEALLNLVEAVLSCRCTGYYFTLNSYENRVYEFQIENLASNNIANGGASYVVAKFYRPGRWTKEALLEEHCFLHELQTNEVTVAAPMALIPGQHTVLINDQHFEVKLPGPSLAEVGGLFFCFFPKIRGRSVDELAEEGWERMGRLLGRLHNIGATGKVQHRPHWNPTAIISEHQQIMKQGSFLPSYLREKWNERVIFFEKAFQEQISNSGGFPELIRIHNDFHRGNLLETREGWVLLDFDDFTQAPAVQDLWMLLPGTVSESALEIKAFCQGYEVFRSFPDEQLDLIPCLRILRFLNYQSWVAHRYADPYFKKGFPQFAESSYWETQYHDLAQMLDPMRA